MTTDERIAFLRTQITLADEAYWTLGVSDISDTEYDALCLELEALTGDDGGIKAPAVTSDGKVIHPVPMLSMQKVYDIESVLKWYERYGCGGELIVMPKYDGIAIAQYGEVLATRGDSKIGEDVSWVREKLGVFAPSADSKYGEMVCTVGNFEYMREFGYKNPRNAVSGIMNSLDPEIQERAEYLTYVDYRSNYRRLPMGSVTMESLQEAVEFILQCRGTYPMDGIVFRLADDERFAGLGHTDHHWRGQIALKFKNASTESIIEAIEWQEKNGTITPVAHVAPVTLDGAEIHRCTLHNYIRVIADDIRVGDRCEIERAGGVVPKIVRTWHEAHDGFPETRIPDRCPTCGEALLNLGKRLYCPKCDK
jgi:DNA ligase (NAD+)